MRDVCCPHRVRWRVPDDGCGGLAGVASCAAWARCASATAGCRSIGEREDAHEVRGLPIQWITRARLFAAPIALATRRKGGLYEEGLLLNL